MAEPACVRLRRQPPLRLHQAFLEPVAEPGGPPRLVDLQLVGEITAHAWHDQRMVVGREQQRQ
jgi:hypothetical protein